MNDISGFHAEVLQLPQIVVQRNPLLGLKHHLSFIYLIAIYGCFIPILTLTIDPVYNKHLSYKAWNVSKIYTVSDTKHLQRIMEIVLNQTNLLRVRPSYIDLPNIQVVKKVF